MARARNIKPGFFRDADLVDLPIETRLLFIGLWTIADREGRLDDRPKQIKMEVFPADSFDIESMLLQLHDAGFIERYTSNGNRYIQVTNFTKHQNPHRDEKASTIPAPCKHGASTVAIGLIPDSLIPDSLIPEKPPAPEKPARFDPMKVSLPESIEPAAWSRWIEYRRKRRLSNTEQTISAQLARLVEWAAKGHDPGLIIAESIASGWQGVFEPKSSHPPNHAGKFDPVAYVNKNRKTENEPIAGTAERVV